MQTFENFALQHLKQPQDKDATRDGQAGGGEVCSLQLHLTHSGVTILSSASSPELALALLLPWVLFVNLSA
jgi:hypothetical protein